MTTVDLENISLEIPRRWAAVSWLQKNYGPISNGKWTIKDLRYVTFEDEKHATFFILRWSS